mmetsp:Transcript_104024/g.179234  ORF Transcript_104024/g.179234 Transcript_104024/m.179234 type:complete len:206 (-) Transcript_104024:101-718(-)
MEPVAHCHLVVRLQHFFRFVQQEQLPAQFDALGVPPSLQILHEDVGGDDLCREQTLQAGLPVLFLDGQAQARGKFQWNAVAAQLLLNRPRRVLGAAEHPLHHCLGQLPIALQDLQLLELDLQLLPVLHNTLHQDAGDLGVMQLLNDAVVEVLRGHVLHGDDDHLFPIRPPREFSLDGPDVHHQILQLHHFHLIISVRRGLGRGSS